MKIGIDCRALSQFTDGIGKYTLRLIEQLGKIDKGNQYVLFFNNEHYGQKNYGQNFVSVIVPYRHLTLRSLFLMGALANKYNLDLFHSLFFIMPYGIRCKKMITVPDLMALKVRNFFSGRPWLIEMYARNYHKIFVPGSIKRADKIITISNATRDDVNQLLGMPKDNMTAIPLGVDDTFYRRDGGQIRELANKYILPEKYILYTGNTKPYKNILGLIKSYKIFKEKGGVCKLVMISYKDRFRESIDKLIVDLKLNKDVLFMDNIANDDLPIIMSRAQMFVFVSLYEGFGLPPLEAMACGWPHDSIEYTILERSGRG